MNEVEAIEYLQYSKCDERNADNRQHNDALDLAISALEKQVGKEVDNSMLNYSNLPVSRCPVCASSGISPYKDNYCYNCATKFDWSETK